MTGSTTRGFIWVDANTRIWGDGEPALRCHRNPDAFYKLVLAQNPQVGIDISHGQILLKQCDTPESMAAWLGLVEVL